MKAPLLASRGGGKGLHGDGWFLLARGEGNFSSSSKLPRSPQNAPPATGGVPGQSATGRSRDTPQEQGGPSCPPACGLKQTKAREQGQGQATGTPPACMAKTGTRITGGQRESAAAHGSHEVSNLPASARKMQAPGCQEIRRESGRTGRWRSPSYRRLVAELPASVGQDACGKQ